MAPLDDLTLISQHGLEGSFHVMRTCLELIERSRIYENVVACEPQLGKRGLYPSLSTKESGKKVRAMMNVIAFADGTRDTLRIAEDIREDPRLCMQLADTLTKAGVLREVRREIREPNRV